jgi:hypothetical protein
MKEEIIVDNNIYIKSKKKTKYELYAELFSILDKRIQNMSEEEYQEYKRKRINY